MLVNAHTEISTSSILLVPYCKHHVPKYHEWMQDEEIQEATASEPLSLEEEYAMQASWRQDADKLTFIACLPLPPSTEHTQHTTENGEAGPERMVGDVNLFVRLDDEDDSSSPSKGITVIGEIELMIAEKHNQRRGYGRGALLAFLRYVCEHERDILDEFLRSREKGRQPVADARRFQCFSVKIGQTNTRSLALFESLGFAKVSKETNYFGEFELRRLDLTLGSVGDLEERFGVTDYLERRYRDGS